ncbi:DUF3231 family protein [Virgibacillus kimchii]
MTNLFENIADIIKTTVDGEDKPPLHLGEAFACWLYLSTLHEEVPSLDIALNTTKDRDLIELIQEAKKLGQSQMDKLEKFMIDESIPLGMSSEVKPKTDPAAIPPGVKLTDYEMANYLSAKVVSNTTLCATNMNQSIRTDMGLLWLKFFGEKAQFGFKLKTTMRKRGWIKNPPSYLPNGVGENN